MTPTSAGPGAALTTLALLVFCCQPGAADEGRAPRITEHPVAAVVPRHDPVTLSCKADGRPPPNVTWTKDGEPLGPSQHRVLLLGSDLFFLRVEAADAGVYRCVAANAIGQAVSKDASLEVAFLRHDFRVLPSAQLVSAGETAVLQCAAPRGRPEPVVFWRKDGRRLEADKSADKLGDGKQRLRLLDGGNLAIQGARSADSGRYQCVAQNAAGTREAPEVLLQVAVPPSLHKGPQDATVLVGADVEFPCSVSGDPPPDVLWRRTSDSGDDEDPVGPAPPGQPGPTAAAADQAKQAAASTVAMPLGRVHVTESRALKITNVQLADAGQYVCEADNKAGALSAAAILTVIAMPVLGPTPPGLLTVEEGGDAVLECGAHGSPAPSVFWALRGNRTLLVPGTTGRYHVERSTQDAVTLTIKNVTRGDTGAVLVCSAVNAAGALVARTRLLVLGHDEVPPPVIEVGPTNQTLPLRSSVVLPCQTGGKTGITITWYKDEKPLSGKLTKARQESDGSLHLQALETSDSGKYKCVASSRRGYASFSSWLTVTNQATDKIERKGGSPPGPPSRPHVVSSTNTSVILAWRRNNKAGSSPLIGYQVEMFGPEKGGWEIVAQRVPSSSYNLKDLVPGVAYSFVVRAENSNGLSAPSELTVPIVLPLHDAEISLDSGLEEDASVEDGPVIRLSQVIPVSATSVKLLWEVLDSEQVTGLSIYWRSVNEDSLRTLSVLQSGAPSLGFIVTGLNCYTKYQFFLVPFNNAGEGRPSNMQGARTLADAPTAPPSQLEAHFLNISTVSITWSPPPAASHNGFIETYEVVVKGGDPPELLSNVTLTADTTGPQQLLLSNLSQQVTYHIVVAAVTSAGRGPFSAPIIFQSPSAFNRPVTNPESKNDSQPTTSHPSIQRDPGVSAGNGNNELVTETWFMALLGSMVAVMVLLFSAILFLHRRQHKAKKGAYPHLHMYDSRSNGGVLSLKVAEAEVEVEGAPLCIAPRPGTRMIWGTNNTLGGGSISGPEYAEARPLRSDCQGSGANSEYAEVKSKYSLLSTFQGQNNHCYPHPQHTRPHSGCSGGRCRTMDYNEPGGCCSCDCESQCCSGSNSASGVSDGSGSTVAYATTTLVETNKSIPSSRISPPTNLPFPSLSWNHSCEPTPCTPQTKRLGTGHYSDTYQQHDISKSLGKKRTATTLNLKPQPWQKSRNRGQINKSSPPHPPPSQLQSGLAFLRTPQYNDYAFCQTPSSLRD